MIAAGLHLIRLWPEVDWGDLIPTPPSITYQDTVRLYCDDIPVEPIHVAPAHTRDDTAVWLPEQRVLCAGDLVMAWVTPFCITGSVAGSLVAIDLLRDPDAQVIVPEHGPVCGPEVLDDTAGYLRLVQRLAEDGLAAGASPCEVAAGTALGRYEDWLDRERLVPNLRRAYAEAQGVPLGAAMPVDELFQEMVDFHGGLPECRA
jgi:cyclase